MRSGVPLLLLIMIFLATPLAAIRVFLIAEGEPVAHIGDGLHFGRLSWNLTQSREVSLVEWPEQDAHREWKQFSRIQHLSLVLPGYGKFEFDDCRADVRRRGSKIVAVKVQLHGQLPADAAASINDMMDKRWMPAEGRELDAWLKRVESMPRRLWGGRDRYYKQWADRNTSFEIIPGGDYKQRPGWSWVAEMTWWESAN